MKPGEYQWDTDRELRTRLKLSFKLQNGYNLFTAGKTPLACATLHPDGVTLDVTILVDRVKEVIKTRRGKCKTGN